MQIDEKMIQALAKAFKVACDDYLNAHGTALENQYLFRMNFVKKIAEDVSFLNSVGNASNFYHRYANFIIRNMSEHLIEFCYLNKHPKLIKEYLGLKIKLNKFDQPHTPLQGARWFGKRRFKKGRKDIDEMAKDIGQYKHPDGSLSLYDIFAIYSESCHNSYFDAFLDDISEINTDAPTVGLTDENITAVHTLILCVIGEFPKANRESGE